MSLEKIDLNKGLTKRELRELFQAKIRDVVSPKIDVTSYTMQQLENMLDGVEEVGTLLQRGVDYLKENPHSRRTFLKVTTESVALTLAGFLYGFSPKEADAMGCAHGLIETPEAVANIKWDANPAIPVPKDGCYAGWHRDIPTDIKYISPTAYPDMYPRLNKSAMDDEKALLSSYRADYGKGPAAHSFSDRQITDVWFPKGICEVAHNNGVIPLIRYYFFDQFERVARGEYDKYLIKFAQGAVEFGKPFFFVPYPEVNISGRYKNVHPWAGGSGKKFRKAWMHMHDIFDGEGANDYAVWGLHLLGFGDKQPFSRFDLDDKYLDWVGFTIYNLERQSGYFHSFSEQIGKPYWWAKSKHPTKPMALLELGTSDTSGQGRWIKNAYKDIKKLPRIKLAVYAEYGCFGGSTPESTMISNSAKPDYKKAISDHYFIGSKKL